jgi:hypothetical protein
VGGMLEQTPDSKLTAAHLSLGGFTTAKLASSSIR